MTSSQIESTPHQQLYDTDFVEWIDQAAELLKQGRFDELDLANLIEEVETLGRIAKCELKNNLRALFMHLLKWQYQPEQRQNSGKGNILEHRLRIEDIFDDSPSLEALYKEVFAQTYQRAKQSTAIELELPLETFPPDCPYTTEQVLDQDFLPAETR